MKDVFSTGGRLRYWRSIACMVICLFQAGSAMATVVLSASGTSAKGVEVTFEARLTILGDMLTVQLDNVSPEPTRNPDDLLASFYFDLVDGDNNRPALTYTSGVGDVYRGVKKGPDLLQQADADLVAVDPGDKTWAFEVMDPSLSPFLGFGISTVGNSSLDPNNFKGNIVDGMDYGIYRGEITTQNLHNRLLVKETATFIFAGVSGYTETDISPSFAFGLGTAPDSLLTPEPGAAALFCIGLLGLCVTRRRSRV